ncbi:hypothetical protein [Alteribacter keqinensis]|uniref:Uncharacterized protein n=1 Tax=Alteribacter keqinensis TaxID=2483800 RepID=A0A3M7TZ81_9BACI|nr:hypothetical protein [Alteribacter keqinensis]RNA70601.1 hypothetical protein EBO34_05220 [Alteribacter keqinensis]
MGSYLPIILFAALICVVALISTIIIGVNPADRNYTNKKSMKKRLILLSMLYIIAFVPALIWTVVYYYFLR